MATRASGEEMECKVEAVGAAINACHRVHKPKYDRCLLKRSRLLPLDPNNRDADWATGFVGYLHASRLI
jgi:hypothetical protein